MKAALAEDEGDGGERIIEGEWDWSSVEEMGGMRIGVSGGNED